MTIAVLQPPHQRMVPILSHLERRLRAEAEAVLELMVAEWMVGLVAVKTDTLVPVKVLAWSVKETTAEIIALHQEEPEAEVKERMAVLVMHI